jgi:5-methylcytosine-specific restriction endonuclease McrBC regulatory subunit McrC
LSKIHDDIVLSEHDTWSGFKNGDKIKLNDLKSEDSIVLDELEKQYNVKYSFNKNSELKIESNQFIGSVQLENINCRINIVPKMFKDKSEYWIDTSVFLFFANNINIKKFLEDQKNFFESGSDHLINPLHIDLISKCKKLMNRGLLKSYVENRENSSSLRGKLLMQHQMINDLMRKPKFFCEYDELEYDSTENRVLLQAMTIVERTSHNSNIKMTALDFAQKLSGVIKKVNVQKPERQRMMRSYNRQNDRYKQIHQTCERLIEKEGIGNIYSGALSVVPVFYDMNKEFERFVGNLFKKYYQKPNWVKTGNEIGEEAWSSKGSGDRRMKPDIIVEDDNGDVKEIIDVKYKTKRVSTGDLYQIGFYMHEYGKNRKIELDQAFAILPKSDKLNEDSYTSTKKNKTVYQRILDVSKCVKMMKDNDEDGLKSIVRDLIKVKN